MCSSDLMDMAIEFWCSIGKRERMYGFAPRPSFSSEQSMTPCDRIDQCLKLAHETGDVDTCDAYIAEATGLMGKPQCMTIDGYLRERSYKEAWADCPRDVRVAIKKLPHFNAAVFEEITGLKLEE